eukprot:3246601-Prymnesium_polylepis.1
MVSSKSGLPPDSWFLPDSATTANWCSKSTSFGVNKDEEKNTVFVDRASNSTPTVPRCTHNNHPGRPERTPLTCTRPHPGATVPKSDAHSRISVPRTHTALVARHLRPQPRSGEGPKQRRE